MNRTPGVKLGALLLLLTAILLLAGCTQPSSVSTSIPAPVATTATPAAIETTLPGNQTLKVETARLATSFAREINGKTFATAMAEGPNSTAFATIVGQLKAFKATESRIAYVYTLEQQNGTVRFIMVSNYGQPGSAGFMETYPGAPAILEEPISGPTGVGPYTDPWGTFISGYAPLNMSSNGTIKLMAVDIRV